MRACERARRRACERASAPFALYRQNSGNFKYVISASVIECVHVIINETCRIILKQGNGAEQIMIRMIDSEPWDSSMVESRASSLVALFDYALNRKRLGRHKATLTGAIAWQLASGS